MTKTVLVVDDEPRVLDSLKRSLHHVGKVLTADGAARALELLDANDDVAVVLSDMRMPETDGVELLSAVRQRHPNVVRMMLTGNNDLETAKRAVNEGAVFRYLNKPCERADLKEAVEAGIEAYQLQAAERDVLDRTLGASVKVMAEILALAKPTTFGDMGTTEDLADRVGAKVGVVTRWPLRAAANLCGLGYLTLAPALLEKLDAGQTLSTGEQRDYQQHAVVAAQMLEAIPRMEPVADILRSLELDHGAVGAAQESAAPPLGSRVLRAVRDYQRHVDRGVSPPNAIGSLRENKHAYDPAVLDVLFALVDEEDAGTSAQTMRLSPSRLVEGMVIMEDVYSVGGVLLVKKGRQVSDTVARHLMSFEEQGNLAVPPLVKKLA